MKLIIMCFQVFLVFIIVKTCFGATAIYNDNLYIGALGSSDEKSIRFGNEADYLQIRTNPATDSASISLDSGSTYNEIMHDGGSYDELTITATLAAEIVLLTGVPTITTTPSNVIYQKADGTIGRANVIPGGGATADATVQRVQGFRMSGRTGAAINAYSKSIGYSAIDWQLLQGDYLMTYAADDPGDAGFMLTMSATAMLDCTLIGSEDTANSEICLIVNGDYNQTCANNNISKWMGGNPVERNDAIIPVYGHRILKPGDFMAPVFTENTGGASNSWHSIECTARGF